MVCAKCGFGDMLVRHQQYGDKVVLSYWCAKCGHTFDVNITERERG